MSDEERMSDQHDCGGDAAAYVLGALDPSELESFHAHLERCAVCRDEVAALRGVVQALPMSAPQHPAPRGLRRRIMREVRRDLRARSGRRSSAPSAWVSPRAAVAALAVTAVAAAALITGLELGAGGGPRVIQANVTGATGTAQLRLSSGRGELVVRHLSPPGRGHVYEVWLQRGRSSPVPASVMFGVSRSGYADVGIPGDMRGVSTVMVTREPIGGASAPTQAPVIVAHLG